MAAERAAEGISYEFFHHRYIKQVEKLIGKIRILDGIVMDLDGVTDPYAPSHIAMRGAMRRADKKGTIVQKNSLQYSICQTIGWLNSRHMEEEGSYFLTQRYGYGDIKISSLSNPEGDGMIKDFLKAAGHEIDNFYFLSKKVI